MEAERCPYCAQPPVLEVLEAWNLLTGEFLAATCCEASEADFRENWRDPKLLNRLGIGELLGSPVRGVIDEDPFEPVLDCRLHLGPLAQRDAKAFIHENHRHCPPPAGWKLGIAARNAGRLVGVAWVGRPVARRLDNGSVLEVNRLCTLDSPLAKQAASMLLAAAARAAKRAGARQIITYTRLDESGVSLIAAGWQRDGESRGGSRSRAGRQRSDHNTGPKQRWVRQLR